MKTFKVYVEQVNQTMYEVRAASEENAYRAASKLWRQENGQPHVGEVHEVKGNHDKHRRA